MILTAEQRQFLLTALAPNPGDRFSSVAAMAAEFMKVFSEFDFLAADREYLLAAVAANENKIDTSSSSSGDSFLLSAEKAPGGLDFETVGDKIKAKGHRIKILTKDPQQVRDILDAKAFRPVVYSITPIPAGGLTKYLFSMN